MDDRETKEAWLERAMEQYEESLLRMCFAYLGDAALAERFAAQHPQVRTLTQRGQTLEID